MGGNDRQIREQKTCFERTLTPSFSSSHSNLPFEAKWNPNPKYLPFCPNFRMWAGCTGLLFTPFSFVLVSIEWKCVFTAAIAFLTALKRVHLRGEYLTTGDLYLSGVWEGKRWGGWGVRMGWETGKSRWPGHALSLSPGCSQVWNTALFFWSWKQSTCWRPGGYVLSACVLSLVSKVSLICTRANKASSVNIVRVTLRGQ